MLASYQDPLQRVFWRTGTSELFQQFRYTHEGRQTVETVATDVAATTPNLSWVEKAQIEFSVAVHETATYDELHSRGGIGLALNARS